MRQHKNIGGGVASDEIYRTWTIQSCPSCERLVKEVYECRVITEADLKDLEKEEEREEIDEKEGVDNSRS